MKKQKPEEYLFRVEKGSLIPNDSYTQEQLRDRHYCFGDILVTTLKKSRNPRFHRLAHALGQLMVDNIESFENLTAHAALKRLQLEAQIACDPIVINIPGFGMVTQFIPRSLSFSSMDEGEFFETIRNMSRYIAKTYWKDMDEDEILRMAEVMP